MIVPLCAGRPHVMVFVSCLQFLVDQTYLWSVCGGGHMLAMLLLLKMTLCVGVRYTSVCVAQNSLKPLVRAPRVVWEQLCKKSFLTTVGPTGDYVTPP